MSDEMIETQLRDRIVSLGRSLATRGLSPGTSGNISARLRDGWLMTPTGLSLAALAVGGLSRLGPDGRLIDGPAPTKELPLHLAMYAQHPEAQAIVHLHSTYSVALACLDSVDPDDVLPPLTPYFAMRVGRLLLVPYARPGSQELAQAVRLRARQGRALLLANHGPIVAGASLEAASSAIEEVEESAKLVLLLQGLPTRRLSPADVAALGPSP